MLMRKDVFLSLPPKESKTKEEGFGTDVLFIFERLGRPAFWERTAPAGIWRVMRVDKYDGASLCNIL